MLTAVTQVLAGHALARVEQLAATLPEMPSMDRSDPASWGRAEFRSTSAWSFPEVLGELGRFNSASWVGEVDVPTAVVVTERDHTIPRAPAAQARRRRSRVPRLYERTRRPRLDRAPRRQLAAACSARRSPT